MNILGIDVSGKCTGIYFEKDNQISYSETLELGLTHSETLLPLVKQALEMGNCSPENVDCYSVTIGPGSFTGLRIGIAMVKGLAFSQNTPIAAVSTLHAMAQGSGLQGTVVCALDARREQLYWAAFECDGENAVRVTEDCASNAKDVAETKIFRESPVFIIGDGAEICYNALGNLQKNAIVDDFAGKNTAKGAVFLAHEMIEENKLLSVDQVEPIYLKLSQAERERAEKIDKEKTMNS